MAIRRPAAVVPILFFLAIPAFAQNNRSAVSVTGSDTNPCTTTAPCRSFTAALAVTNSGGEVIAIDSGGYGPFTVTQPASVIGAPGIHAAITSSTTNAISVNTGGIFDRVEIRGLTITLTGLWDGINAPHVGVLVIEKVIIRGGQDGISVYSQNSQTTVVDSEVHGTTNDGFGFSGCRAVLVRCLAEGNSGDGLVVFSGSVGAGVSATDFVSQGNGTGAEVSTPTGNIAFLTLERALIAQNVNDGVLSINPGATAGVGRSVIANNGFYGLEQANQANFLSMKNNIVMGNGAGDSNGTIGTLNGK